MSGGWIKFEKVLENDPRVRRMARELRNACVTQERFKASDSFFSSAFFVTQTLGCLSRLWFYADTHIREDDTIEIGVDDIDEIVGVHGFAQVLPEDWLEVLDAETVKLPGFHGHNGTDAKKQALTNKRVARLRERVALGSFNSERSSNADVTPDALPDLDKTRPRQDQEKNRTAAAPPTLKRRDPVPHETPEWFLTFKLAYPERGGGDYNWQGALRAANARIGEGHTAAEFIAGAERYAEFCRATEKIGTEFVKQASTFLGPGKAFLLPWTAPATTADTRLRSNLSAAEEFMRRTDTENAA